MANNSKKAYFFYGLLSFTIPLLIILYSFRIWEMNLSVPMSFGGDNLLGSILIKGISEHGIKGLYINESIGMPELSSLVDTPFLDLSFGVEAFFISIFFKSTQTIFYVLYILSYPICGLTSYVLLNRMLSDVQPINVLFSCIFAIAPYHFSRGMGHSTLSRYFVVPMTLFIALVVYEEDLKFGLPKKYGVVKKAIFLLLCLFIGICNIYYAFGGLLLIATASMVKGIRDKRWSVLINEMISAYYILVGVVLGLSPKIYYTFKYGKNTEAALRNPGSTEVFGLKIIQMLLPCDYNRIPFLYKLSKNYEKATYVINENKYASLGMVASIGFILACIWIIIKFSSKHNDNNDEKRYIRTDIISFFILIMVLYATVGGVGTIVAFTITPELRGLNRFSIIIACASLAILNIWTGYFFKTCKQKIKRILGIILIMVITGISVYSEVLVQPEGWQEEAKQQDHRMKEYFSRVEDYLPENTMVYQLPYVDFPESPDPVNMVPYEHGLAYIYTDSLRWSYGAMKGRDTKASELYIDDGMSYEFVDGIKEAGFDAVYVDTHGYEDGGIAVIDFYSSQLGIEPVSSEDGWLYVFKLK